MSGKANLVEARDLAQHPAAVIFDCRFSLADIAEGEARYRESHIPGAHYLHLERDMSGPVLPHGGRHPLPSPAVFADRLATFGVSPETEVIAYDDHRFAYVARLWWMMKSLGYRPPLILNGGYRAWLSLGAVAEAIVPMPTHCQPGEQAVLAFHQHCDISGLRAAQKTGCTLVDSREERRYQGLEEPIDPVAGHIPAAVNRPWQGVTNSDGMFRPEEEQRSHWGGLLGDGQLVVYCGSGVTACVNLFSLASLGRGDAVLYAGSWSDWCSYL